MNLDYPVILTPDDNGTVLVTFPDVPEATTFGDDEDEALMRAVDALDTALSFYTDDGRDLPKARRPSRGQRTVHPSAQASVALLVYQAMRGGT